MHTPSERPADLLRLAAKTLKGQSPGMSLRAVAGRLKISPSYWSKILRGQKPLSPRLLPQIVKVLQLDAQQIARLQRSILNTLETEQLEPSTGIRTTRDSTSPTAGYRAFGREELWLLEQWYYIPILNMFTLPETARNTPEIARRLAVKPSLVAKAVEQLTLAGFLATSSAGVLERTELAARFPTSRSHPQVRRFHRTMIERAARELEGVEAEATFDQRLITSVCFAGSPKKLQEARRIVEEAVYRAAGIMAEDEDCEKIYQLNIQLFPLTK